jgi:[CysO sulfur-carrier protein]-S-L-cysteine hydrolase
VRLCQTVYAAIVEHACAESPIEACGIVVERAGVQSVYAMANADRSESFFRFDPQEQLKMWQQVEDDGGRIVAVYHSHTASAARPSNTDMAYALDPGVVQLICSTSHQQLRAWQVVHGHPVELQVEVD